MAHAVRSVITSQAQFDLGLQEDSFGVEITHDDTPGMEVTHPLSYLASYVDPRVHG